MQPVDKSTLVGFYGAETMEERIERSPPLKMRIGRKRKESKVAGSAEGQSEGTKEEEAVSGEVGREQGSGEGGSRRRRNWLSRKRTN